MLLDRFGLILNAHRNGVINSAILLPPSRSVFASLNNGQRSMDAENNFSNAVARRDAA